VDYKLENGRRTGPTYIKMDLEVTKPDDVGWTVNLPLTDKPKGGGGGGGGGDKKINFWGICSKFFTKPFCWF
jgi:hypothetical protein